MMVCVTVTAVAVVMALLLLGRRSTPKAKRPPLGLEKLEDRNL